MAFSEGGASRGHRALGSQKCPAQGVFGRGKVNGGMMQTVTAAPTESLRSVNTARNMPVCLFEEHHEKQPAEHNHSARD
jgi:hypothetical protein